MTGEKYRTFNSNNTYACATQPKINRIREIVRECVYIYIYAHQLCDVYLCFKIEQSEIEVSIYNININRTISVSKIFPFVFYLSAIATTVCV